MKGKERYEITNFRIVTIIIAILFLLIIVSSRIQGSNGNFFGNLIMAILLFGILAFLTSSIYSIFGVEDLPGELNNMVALFLIGGLIEGVLYIIFPIFGLTFGSIYLLYFISKMDENNKILYNRFN